MVTVTNNCVVSIRYVMKNGCGDILENIMENDPVSYLHGSATILALLQAQLEGLKTGDKKNVHLLAAQGLTNEDFTFEVIVDQVRPASAEEILLGYPVQVSVSKCMEDCECYT